MNLHTDDHHKEWLQDIEYRSAFGEESAKLEIAIAITEARLLAGVTQAVLADRSGVSQAYVAKLERGDANPTIGNVGRLLAGIWMRPDVKPAPLDAGDSFESVLLLVSEDTPTSGMQPFRWEGDIEEASSSSSLASIRSLIVAGQG